MNPGDLARPRLRPLRLKGYDYSGQGPYLVTVCTKDRDNPGSVHPKEKDAWRRTSLEAALEGRT